jgi:hypothetical protein
MTLSHTPGAFKFWKKILKTKAFLLSLFCGISIVITFSLLKKKLHSLSLKTKEAKKQKTESRNPNIPNSEEKVLENSCNCSYFC